MKNDTWKTIRSLGPAIVVAAVVCGPGSILTSSKVGVQFGYSMVWVLIGVVTLLTAMVMLSARLGAGLDRTLCGELAHRLGRPFSIGVGVVLFLVVACYQSSNNVAVIAALESFTSSPEATSGRGLTLLILVVVNAFALIAVYGSRDLYRTIERSMKALVLLMVIAFVANAVAAGPSILAALKGLIPSADSVSGLVKPLSPAQAMVGTTFSVAGAFYQAYLVREKGWTIKDVRTGMIDSVVGIAVLGLISLVIMMTAAAVLHGNVDPASITSGGDVARQLEPLFGGTWARIVFGIGLFAGAFSSFLVNAMIGGLLLSDGLGLGGSVGDRWPKHFTSAALAVGFVVGALSATSTMSSVGVITFAQALTVLGLPALAAALLYLGTRKDLGAARPPRPVLVLAWIGFGLSLLLAVRTSAKLISSVAG